MTTALTVRLEPATFSELYFLLLQFESRLEQANQQSQTQVHSTAFLAQNNRFRGRGRVSNSRTHNQGRVRNAGRSNNHASSILGSDPSDSSRSNQLCQICNLRGHSALRCSQRFNQNIQADDLCLCAGPLRQCPLALPISNAFPTREPRTT